MVKFEPGVYVVNQTILLADLCGERIVRPALGTADEQLNRSTERGSERTSRDTLDNDDSATATYLVF